MNARNSNQLDALVKDHYDALAMSGVSTSCCSPSVVYSPEELRGIPQTVLELSSSCGSPIKSLNIVPGQTVLDLGCGAGLDVILLARKLGPKSRIIGLDASPNMLSVAKKAVNDIGIQNVEFILGDVRQIPMESETVDVVISNCVIGMFPDKDKVFQEIYRVLKYDGYMIGIDTIYSEKNFTTKPVANDWASCLIMTSEQEYVKTLQRVGFTNVEFRDKSNVRYRDGNTVTSAKIFATKTI